jgi:hypothetical protein
LEDPHAGFRTGGLDPRAIAAALSSWLATAAVMISSLGCLCLVGNHSAAPENDSPPGSGIVIRTELTSIWLPRRLYDLVRSRADRTGFRSAEELRSLLDRFELDGAWYALNYRGYQVDGRVGEITQIRRVSEAAVHLDELEAVMDAALGRGSCGECVGRSHARVEVIPDSMQDVDPREAITRLNSGPAATDTP